MRRLVALLASATVAAGGVAGSAVPAYAKDTPPTEAAHAIKTSPYVALGDSYSSAAGVLPQIESVAAALCSRSKLNFAEDIAAATHPASFTDVTCSGAKTQDFFTSQGAGIAPQLDAVSKNTRLVTMTIGGNDEDVFVNSLAACIGASDAARQAGQGISGHPCKTAYGTTFTHLIRTQTKANLIKALAAVRAKAPRAKVVILGYPRILPDTGVLACYSKMPVSMGDVPYLVHQQKVLNDVIEQAAEETGARFVNTFTRGHDACQAVGTRWIEPFVGNINAAQVHPNATGEQQMAKFALAAIRR